MAKFICRSGTATGILESWGDDVCATCMCELSFTHRCDPKDIATDMIPKILSVRDTIHALERTDTEKPAPIQMGFNFFHDAEGQSDNEDEDENEADDSSSSESSRSHSSNSDNGSDSPPYASDSDQSSDSN
jgi:hypothetical protein